MLNLHPLVQSVRRTLTALGVRETDRIGVAVSGGADSMVLLQVLHGLGYAVEAYHVNFRLRGRDSDEDAGFVQAWCAAQRIACEIHEVDTMSHVAMTGLNVQEAARDIRYAWWAALHRAGRFDVLATGHHLDDNIETLLMRLLRGTGLRGLQGIPPRRDYIIRPMIELPAGAIRDFARQMNIPWREDSSNRKDDYFRNRVRNSLLPLLDELAPEYRSALRRTMARMRVEAAGWSAMSPLIVEEKDGEWHIACPRQGIAWLCEWLEARDIPWPLSYDFLKGNEAQHGGVLTHGGWTLARTGRDRFTLFRELDWPDIEIPAPGTYVVMDMALHIDMIPHPGSLAVAPGEKTAYMSPSAVAWPLACRLAREGDRLRPLGMAGHTKKLQDLFTDDKVPVSTRRNSIILADAHEVLWIPGYRLSEVVKVRPGEEDVLRFRLIP